MRKYCHPLGIIMCVSLFTLAMSSCDDRMTGQPVDTLVDTVIGDSVEETMEPELMVELKTDPEILAPEPVAPPLGERTSAALNPAGIRSAQTKFAGMVLIPVGEFLMGDSSADSDIDTKPVHSVHVDAFYMDEYEVTNAEYAAFLNANKHFDAGWPGYFRSIYGNHW